MTEENKKTAEELAAEEDAKKDTAADNAEADVNESLEDSDTENQ